MSRDLPNRNTAQLHGHQSAPPNESDLPLGLDDLRRCDVRVESSCSLPFFAQQHQSPSAMWNQDNADGQPVTQNHVLEVPGRGGHL